MSKPRLLYYEILNYQDSVLKLMHDNFEVIALPDPNHDNDDMLRTIEIAMAPLAYEFGKDKINHCPNLKLIASSTLSIPHIDMVYAESKGIKVCSLADEKEFLYSVTPTAELTWGLIIALTRRIPWAHKSVCSGGWYGRYFGRKTPRMLSKMTLGILGLGRLGSMTASYGTAFGMKVYYFSPNSRNKAYERCETLEELAMVSDVLSVHAHLTPSTEKIIDRAFIQSMRAGSFIVNNARGALIDESALLEALEAGHLAGAALDVLSDEYQPSFKYNLKDNPLVKYAVEHDNLLITPHYAGATVDAWEKTQMRLLQKVIFTYFDKRSS